MLEIERAFAAIRSEGAIVAWGDPRCGGDCSAVREQLHCARAIQATDYAFAVTRSDNVVITWSLAEYGEWRCREPAGDCRRLRCSRWTADIPGFEKCFHELYKADGLLEPSMCKMTTCVL